MLGSSRDCAAGDITVRAHIGGVGVESASTSMAVGSVAVSGCVAADPACSMVVGGQGGGGPDSSSTQCSLAMLRAMGLSGLVLCCLYLKKGWAVAGMHLERVGLQTIDESPMSL